MPAELCQDHQLSVPEINSSKYLNGESTKKKISYLKSPLSCNENEKTQEKLNNETQSQSEVACNGAVVSKLNDPDGKGDLYKFNFKCLKFLGLLLSN